MYTSNRNIEAKKYSNTELLLALLNTREHGCTFGERNELYNFGFDCSDLNGVWAHYTHISSEATIIKFNSGGGKPQFALIQGSDITVFESVSELSNFNFTLVRNKM